MISKCTLNDLDNIVLIFTEAKNDMNAKGYTEWGKSIDDYPNKNKFIFDISEESLYKYVHDKTIKGLITIAQDKDNEYNKYIEGSSEKSYIIHRLVIPKKFQRTGIASKLLKFAEDLAIKNEIKVIKSAVEIKNINSNNLFKKNNYKCFGKFNFDDYPGTYNYYEKEVK